MDEKERLRIKYSIADMKAEKEDLKERLSHACKRQAELRRRKGGERFLWRYRMEIKQMIDQINLLNANISGLEGAMRWNKEDW